MPLFGLSQNSELRKEEQFYLRDYFSTLLNEGNSTETYDNVGNEGNDKKDDNSYIGVDYLKMMEI